MMDVPVSEKKEKVTLYLDASVLRFYRAQGRGYQARINRLLATYAHMKVAREVQMEAALIRRIEEMTPKGEEKPVSEEGEEHGDS